MATIRRYWTEMLVGLFALALGAAGQRAFQPLGPPAPVPAVVPVQIDQYLAGRLATVPERLSSVEAELRALTHRIDQLEDRRAHASRAQ